MNSFYKELIKKVHPDVSSIPNATRICQEVNNNKDNPEYLKFIAKKYNIKVSFSESNIIVEFKEGTVVVIKHHEKYLGYMGTICKIKNTKHDYKEYYLLTNTEKILKIKAFDPKNVFEFKTVKTTNELRLIKERFDEIKSFKNMDGITLTKFKDLGLTPNTDYRNSSVFCYFKNGKRYGWFRILKTTSKTIKFRNHKNKSGYGVANIKNVINVEKRDCWWG